jgi:endonuclease-3
MIHKNTTFIRMKKLDRYQSILNYFRQNMPVAETELMYTNPYELLVAVILSAQCTDKRVNLTTPALFKRFPDVQSMSAASAEEIFEYIKSISYPNNKAKHLAGMARMLVSHFNGEVPANETDLIQLPGVGRKTANVISSVVFKKAAMAVDTHVFRVSKRLGLVSMQAKTPLEVEKELMKYIPEKEVHIAHHWLILHGRYTCTARTPGCGTCGLAFICPSYNHPKKWEESKMGK